MKATFKLTIEDTQKIVNYYFPGGINYESTNPIFSDFSTDEDNFDNLGSIYYCPEEKNIVFIPYSKRSRYELDVKNNTLMYCGPLSSMFNHDSVDMYLSGENPTVIDEINLENASYSSSSFQDIGEFDGIEAYKLGLALHLRSFHPIYATFRKEIPHYLLGTVRDSELFNLTPEQRIAEYISTYSDIDYLLIDFDGKTLLVYDNKTKKCHKEKIIKNGLGQTLVEYIGVNILEYVDHSVFVSEIDKYSCTKVIAVNKERENIWTIN
jgi:hypothetical protein